MHKISRLLGALSRNGKTGVPSLPQESNFTHMLETPSAGMGLRRFQRPAGAQTSLPGSLSTRQQSSTRGRREDGDCQQVSLVLCLCCQMLACLVSFTRLVRVGFHPSATGFYQRPYDERHHTAVVGEPTPAEAVANGEAPSSCSANPNGEPRARAVGA